MNITKKIMGTLFLLVLWTGSISMVLINIKPPIDY